MKKTIELREGTVRHLQAYVAAKLRARGFADETLHERLLLLTEGLGELVHACRKISGMNIDQNREIAENPGEELADVLNLAFAVGIELGLDIEKEFRTKEKKIDRRVYARASKKK